MKGHVENYSKLLIEEIQSGMEVHSAIVKLKKILKARRHSTLLRSVLERTDKILSQSRDHTHPTLIVASEKGAKEYAGVFTKREDPLVKIDPTILGGYVAMENFTVIDNSYKSKLLSWYRAAVKRN